MGFTGFLALGVLAVLVACVVLAVWAARRKRYGLAALFLLSFLVFAAALWFALLELITRM